MEGVPVASVRRRAIGEIRRAELVPAGGDKPPIVVEFVIPDPVAYAQIEADARLAMDVIVRNPAALARYGLADKGLSADQAQSLREPVFLVEAAIRLWKDWNISLTGGEAADPITPGAVAALLMEDPHLRAVWHVHLLDATATDISEGNGSAASPSMSSGQAAPTADAAPKPEAPAPEASPAPPGGTAIGLSSSPAPGKVRSPAKSARRRARGSAPEKAPS